MRVLSEHRARRGMTLLELSVALGLLAVMTAAVTLNVDRQARNLGASTQQANLDLSADILLDRIAERLEFARIAPAASFLTADASGGDGSIRLDDLDGFPPAGTLVLDPGAAAPERAEYTAINQVTSRIDGLDRGAECTAGSVHLSGTRVQWQGVARVLEDQVAPAPSDFSGLSRELRGDLFFIGEGTGFSYQFPVRLGAGGGFFDADGEMLWGATVNGAERTTGYCAFEFAAERAVLEANLGQDLNNDGDQIDVFDLGTVRLRIWDAANPGDPEQLADLSPAMILQERCAYGADLDGDGLEDPMFLIEPETGRLRVRIFSLLETRAGVSVRRDETAFQLDNSAQG